LAAAGAVAVQVPGLVSSTEMRRSQTAEQAGNGGLAYAWANAAVSAEPWAADPYEQRALVLEAAGRLRPAAQDLGRAIAHEPDNFVHWLLRSRIETELGEIAAAARDYERARQLRPLAAVFANAPHFSGLPRKR
jgi:tetratricopeptide (TPR) repeat protein